MEKNNKDLLEKEMEVNASKENLNKPEVDESIYETCGSLADSSFLNPENQETAQEKDEEAPIEPSEQTATSSKLPSYVCTLCGYIYDPVVGDPDNDVQPGTAFDDIPEDWVCPMCGASKDEFEIQE